MSRALLTTCALLAGAVVVGYYATAPECEGWYCIALGDKPAAQQDARSSGVPAAGKPVGDAAAGPSGSGQQMFAGPDFEADPAEPSSGTALSEAPSAPRVRPAETQSARSFDAFVDEDPADWVDDEADTPARRIAAEKAAQEAADAWEALTVTALEDPDPRKRGTAIGDVGLHRHDDAVTVLLEVAASESDPGNRYQALQSLWYSAADGLDRNGDIRTTLEQAAQDPDPQIAEMAEKALKDLNALENAETR